MRRFTLSVVELRFGASYWVGILAEVEPDGEIAARFNLNAREVESRVTVLYLHTYPCSAIIFTC
jgi:hypothetical protein